MKFSCSRSSPSLATMSGKESTGFSVAATRAAVRAEQVRLGLPADGWPDLGILLNRL